ncbi:baseplate J/gp47 family protein [uncultured Thermanaerothrix sp.]|uniref:baseplate J/gp47 family protein n=1 Tax=uncultured Thermanaerothrix sp. TaxID=1195149 RepID=UPI0026117AAF|nr:baseplate J/gp47 family protein [uncultured Thermanaerothrix sp.]
MKTYMIRVEPYDDVISVGDKMAWAQAQRIILILPLKRSPRFTRLDWVRLQHHAQSLGALLAVVNRDPETARLCREVGIPVFRTVEAAQKGRWRRHRTSFLLSHAWLSARLQSVRRQREEARALLLAITPKPLSVGRRVGFFLLGVGAVLVLMALLLPSAILEIELPKREQQVEMYVRLSPQTRVVQMSGVVPCKEVDAEVDSQVEETASGIAPWPATYARATLIAQNLTDVSHLIPKGSPFVAIGTQPVRFEALEEVVLPAGIGQSASVPVQAIQAGSGGNVPAGVTWEAEGALGLVIRLSNPTPALGGTESTVTVVSEMDLQRARERVLIVQPREAIRIMEERLEADEILVASTVQLQEILEEHVFPNVGQPANRFQVRMKARYRGCVVRQNDLEDLTRAMLRVQIPSEYRALGDEVRVERLEERAIAKTDSVGLRLRGSWWLIPSIRTDDITQLLVGKPVEETEEILNPLIKGGKVTQIALTPAWWGRFPFLPWRIQVVLR